MVQAQARRRVMVRLDLTPEEVEMLRAIVRSCLSNLRMQIAGTENKDFRERLKEREVFLKSLLQRLQPGGI